MLKVDFERSRDNLDINGFDDCNAMSFVNEILDFAQKELFIGGAFVDVQGRFFGIKFGKIGLVIKVALFLCKLIKKIIKCVKQ